MRARSLAVLATLYLAQGLPYGFFLLALPILMRQRGIDLATIAASGVLQLPWALKFVWGPLIDRFGARRSWIVPLQSLTVLVLIALATISALDPSAELRLLGAGMLLFAVLSSVQDVATDGLAVQLLSEEDRGLGNGIQVGAYRLGMIIGGGAVLVIYARAGAPAAFVFLAALIAMSTVPILLFQEPARQRSGHFVLREALGLLPMLGGAWWVALASFKLGDAMATPMVKTLLVDAGWTPEAMAGLLGFAGSLAGLLGAAIGGRLTDRIGRREALLVASTLQTLALCINLWPAIRGVTTTSAWVTVLAEHVFSGMATTTLFAAMMDRCRDEHEASDFTLQACVVLVLSGFAGALGGSVAEQFGYVVHFAVSVALSLLSVALVALATRPTAR